MKVFVDFFDAANGLWRRRANELLTESLQKSGERLILTQLTAGTIPHFVYEVE
jgi:hypothetical protein